MPEEVRSRQKVKAKVRRPHLHNRQNWATWRWTLRRKATPGRRKRKRGQNVGKREPKRENKGHVRSRNGLPREMAGRKKTGSLI